ncbi:hypothetical protein E4U21_002504 [Claviceps maximensis]|nr:hypothetical protein E4U21_002504 [Claviceps maximensis]
MASMTEEAKRVLNIVRRASLAYPDNELLECFLQDSTDPEQTARYILERCSAAEGGDGLDLGALLADWKRLIAFFTNDLPAPQPSEKAAIAAIFKRDGGRCCITGRTNSLLDPLVVVPLLPVETFHLDKQLHEILGIFVGPQLLDWFLSKAAKLDIFQSHWLVRRSAAVALSQGFFEFEFEGQKKLKMQYCVSRTYFGGPTCPSIVKQAPDMRYDRFSDPSASHVDHPDTSALQLLSSFAEPISWTLVSREIARKRPQTQRARNWQTASLWRCLAERCAAAMSMVWRLLPASVRIRAYGGLAFLGLHVYGSSGTASVQRLPFGMYVKNNSVDYHHRLENEYAAVQLVRRHTLVPVPIALDFVSDSKESCLLTTRIPGIPLGACINTLSHSEEAALVYDLQQALYQLRTIPRETASGYAITNVLGNACYDGRIITSTIYDPEQGDFAGPFVDEAEFHDHLRISDPPDVSQHNAHRIVFTHGDLNMRNILMHNGRLSGIVDWEFAGWYPEYWEYTKAHFVSSVTQRWLRIVDKVFKPIGDFETELEVERKSWRYF